MPVFIHVYIYLLVMTYLLKKLTKIPCLSVINLPHFFYYQSSSMFVPQSIQTLHVQVSTIPTNLEPQHFGKRSHHVWNTNSSLKSASPVTQLMAISHSLHLGQTRNKEMVTFIIFLEKSFSLLASQYYLYMDF